MDPFWLFQNTHRPLVFITPRKTYPITGGLSWWHIDMILLMFFVHGLNNKGENSASIKDSQVKRGNYKQLEPEKKNCDTHHHFAFKLVFLRVLFLHMACTATRWQCSGILMVFKLRVYHNQGMRLKTPLSLAEA